MNQLKDTLVELLGIQGESGREAKVAVYVKSRLEAIGFAVRQDHYGNVLGEKGFGADGPTILLSAHMDTVVPFHSRRRLVWEGDVVRSSHGILGADDRAGIAIILEALEALGNAPIDGTIKVAFTREEEVGRVGSQEIDASWLEGVNTAIVADRRNTRDIVTSCWRTAFCPEELGVFWEEIAAGLGQDDWKACQGGISDALTYAERGIPSVNLSCGYNFEHTDDELLDTGAAADTCHLIVAGLRQLMGGVH